MGTMLFKTGVNIKKNIIINKLKHIHADPHPGNIFIRKHPLDQTRP